MDTMTITKEAKEVSARIVGAGELIPVRLLNAGLDERNGEIVAHGWLDIDSINQLRIGSYQREVLARAGGKKASLFSAVEGGARLPDIMLGMRGENFDTKGHNMVLLDPVYVIDGLQRISALKAHAETYPTQAKNLRIGAEIRFATNQEIEEELFLILNTSRIPVSPNVILRNLRAKFPAVATLYGLSMTDKEFPFYQRIQWNQRMARGDLITALMMAKVAHILHSGNSAWQSGRPRTLGAGLDVAVKEIGGLAVFRNNVKMFADVLDSCWSIKHIEYRATATHVKGNFLFCMARLFSEHANFWDGNKLVVDAAARKKIKTFAIHDPDVVRLASSGTMAMKLLYDLLKEHYNKKMRVGRLQKRVISE